MEAYDEETQDGKLFGIYSKTRSWVSASLGIIVAILGIAVIFAISSLEGTKEVTAASGDSAKMLRIWRDENVDGGYPQERADIIQYNGKEYYFVVDKRNENDEIIKWHFAYDGGIDYVYKDYKYYALTLLAFIVAMFVSQIDYKSASRAAKNSKQFKTSLNYYQGKKQQAEQFTQFIPEFCVYKNKQAYENAKRDIIEEAGVNYNVYMSDKFDLNKLEPWQKKILKRIRKIKIKKLHSSDLLQEQGTLNTKISLLPISESEHQRFFAISGALQRAITSALSGFVVAFGVALGNWWLGVCYGFAILLSAISSSIVATDFVINGLRNRYIAKADLLNEFYNIRQKFIDEVRE